MLLLNLIGYGVIFYTLIIIVFFFVTEKLIDREKKEYDRIHLQENTEKIKRG